MLQYYKIPSFTWLKRSPCCEDWLKSCIIDYLVQNHCSRCDFDNKTFHASQPIKFHDVTKFILLSLQIYSVNMICVMHFCDRSLTKLYLWTASYLQLSQWLYNIYNWQFDIQGLQRKTRSGLKMCFLSWTLNVLLYAY